MKLFLALRALKQLQPQEIFEPVSTHEMVETGSDNRNIIL